MPKSKKRLEEYYIRKVWTLKQLTPNQRQRRRTIIYVYVLLILLILLVSASYTWFALSRTPRVSDMAMYVSSETGLELAAGYDAADEEWGQTIDFLALVGEDTLLKPATWSNTQNTLLTMNYGNDGRIIGNRYSTLTDEQHSNRNDINAYYVKAVFYARTGSDVAVSLGEAIEVNEGENTAGTYVIGTPIWNEQTILHDNGGSGAETAIRIGLAITPINELGETDGERMFYIYEPNYDTHIDPQIIGDQATASIDGSAALIDSTRLIRQTTSSWTEASPVQREVTIKSLGQFTTPTDLFTMKAGEMVRIELYVWLEGQDVDCTNLIEDAQIIANVQFATEYTGQSGLVDIPE